MLETMLDAKTELEAAGLYVACNNARSLWIAANVRDVGDGIKRSDDACTLLAHADRWMAVFPAAGLLTYELPGSLSELVPIITAIYAHYRQRGGSFNSAFRQVVSDADQYLIGRAPAPV